MRKLKQNEGITLIALVITIIVLLILAGITINLTLGQDGIITKAQEAGKNYQEAEKNEQDQLAGLIQQTEGILNSATINGSYSVKKKVNSPKIAGSGLTAVEITQEGKLVNADTTKEEWYSYDGSTNHWANAKTQDGSMFVWIPRFAYKINADKSIDVVFLQGTSKLDSNGNDVTSSSYVDEKGVTGAYIVHPAFQDGSKTGYPNGEWNKEIEGFWMAKFEAGYAGTAGDASTAVDSNIGYSTIYSWNGSTNADFASNYYGTRAVGTKIKYPVFQASKPSMNYIGISDAYDLCKDMTSSKAPYGLTSNVKPHLTKNSEWGAVAYLTQSKYGRNGEEVTINNINLNGVNTVHAVTGYGGASVSATSVSTNLTAIQNGQVAGSWTTSQGQLASSTANTYGIYDLSGGAWEWTAGYIATTSSTDKYNTYGGSLKGESDQYKSKYAGTSATDTDNYAATPNPARVGEAIWETSTSGTGSNSWNSDYSCFPDAGGPFFLRGGGWGDTASAGTFAFPRSNGYCYYFIGFRPVLVVE